MTGSSLARAQVPVVESWAWTNRPIDQLVGFSNRAALVETVAYARRRGYKRPVFVASFQSGNDRAQERLEGFLEGMTRQYPGQSVRTLILHDLPYRLSTGRLLLDKAREQYPDSDLFVFSSDLFAAGALLACQRSGIKVPSELAIIGFGDYEMSEELVPALTTVAVPTKRIGQDAARIILQRLKGGKAGPRKVDLGFDLVARESA